MSEVHKLVTRKQEICAESVELLERFLDMAKKGEIVCVALAAIEPDGAARTGASASDSQVSMIGAVSRLLHRMHMNADESTS